MILGETEKNIFGYDPSLLRLSISPAQKLGKIKPKSLAGMVP